MIGKFVSLLAAILWLPLTSHCELESIPGLGFLACPSEAPGEEKHCEEGCCSVERAPYKSEQSRQVLSAPVLLFAAAILIPVTTDALAEDTRLGVLTAAPPELIQSWNFVSRVASPPRAPSFAS